MFFLVIMKNMFSMFSLKYYVWLSRKLKKSRKTQQGTCKIKAHKSIKYKDPQRFKTQITQTQTQ